MDNFTIDGHIRTITNFISNIEAVGDEMVGIKLPLNKGGKNYTEAFKKVEGAKKSLAKTIEDLQVARAQNERLGE